MRIFLLFFPFLISAGVTAQTELYDEVAEDICNCLEESEAAESSDRAWECMTASISSYRQALRKSLALSASERISRQQLTELLLDPLADNCPLLETLLPMAEEVEYRWSDNPATASGGRIMTPKSPPKNLPETTTTEAPAQWRASGRLIARPGGGQLRLETESGDILSFELPGRAARGQKFRVGDLLNVQYRREWRTSPEGGIVVKVVTEIVL